METISDDGGDRDDRWSRAPTLAPLKTPAWEPARRSNSMPEIITFITLTVIAKVRKKNENFRTSWIIFEKSSINFRRRSSEFVELF